MARREQKSDSDTPKPAKPSKIRSSYTGRKGAIVERTIGSDSPYKTAVSRHFRRHLNQLTNRGPTQEAVQFAKASHNLNCEDGRNAWALHRVLLFGADGRGNG
jgi:hypothetical protein